MNASLENAKRFMERGEFSAAAKELAPLVHDKVPEALFLASTFSVGDTETNEEFEARSFRMLKEAAELGFARAMYALAICYENGDLVAPNEELATMWFKRASDEGYVSS